MCEDFTKLGMDRALSDLDENYYDDICKNLKCEHLIQDTEDLFQSDYCNCNLLDTDDNHVRKIPYYCPFKSKLRKYAKD